MFIPQPLPDGSKKKFEDGGDDFQYPQKQQQQQQQQQRQRHRRKRSSCCLSRWILMVGFCVLLVLLAMDTAQVSMLGVAHDLHAARAAMFPVRLGKSLAVAPFSSSTISQTTPPLPATSLSHSHAEAAGSAAVDIPRNLLVLDIPECSTNRVSESIRAMTTDLQLVVVDTGSALAGIDDKQKKQRKRKRKSKKGASKSPENLYFCNRLDKANLIAWDRLRLIASAGRGQQRTWDTLVLSSCFQAFMKDSTAWSSPERMLAITVVRDPWQRTLDAFASLAQCCQARQGSASCSPSLCRTAGRSVAEFLKANCDVGTEATPADCNLQYRMLTSSNAPKVTAPRDAREALAAFDAVIVHERELESLVVLHLEFGVPWKYLLDRHSGASSLDPSSNSSTQSRAQAVAKKTPSATSALQEKALRTALQADSAVIHEANRALDSRIAKFGPGVVGGLVQALQQQSHEVMDTCGRPTAARCSASDPSCLSRCVERVAVSPARAVCQQESACSVALVGCWECRCPSLQGAGLQTTAAMEPVCTKHSTCEHPREPMCARQWE